METSIPEDLIKHLKIMYVVTAVLALISIVFYFYGKINEIEANKQTKLAVEKANELEQCAIEARKLQLIGEKNAAEAMKQIRRAEEALKNSKK